MSYDGKLRIIRSRDAKKWVSVALIKCKGGDVRDAKLSITPQNELMLNGGVRFEKPIEGHTLQSMTWFSKMAKSEEAFASVEDLGKWRWSTTWHQEVAYSFAYAGKDAHGCLYRSTEGKIETF